MQGKNSGKCGTCFVIVPEKVIGLAPRFARRFLSSGNDIMGKESALDIQSHLISFILRLTRWDEAVLGEGLDRSAKCQVGAFTEEICGTVFGVRWFPEGNLEY
jgi:hypothetical protein